MSASLADALLFDGIHRPTLDRTEGKRREK
jgi:hypothetical protein